jgi:hypothetical protein
VDKLEAHKKRIKDTFDRKEKVDDFQVGDWVLKCDTLRQDKCKHSKFNSLWAGPFMITQLQHKKMLKF